MDKVEGKRLKILKKKGPIFEDIDNLLLSPEMLYGELGFSTFRVRNKKILHRKDHLQRIENFYMKFCLLSEDKVSSLIKEIENDLNSIEKTYEGISRISLFKDGSYFISFRENSNPYFPESYVSLKTCKKEVFRNSNFSKFKIGNYAFFHFYQNEFLKEGEDILYIDENELVLECSMSNICFVKGEEVFFPKWKGNFLPGVMQKNLQEKLSAKKVAYKVLEISREDLSSFDSSWQLNCGIGIRQIKKIDENDMKVNTDLYKRVRGLFI